MPFAVGIDTLTHTPAPSQTFRTTRSNRRNLFLRVVDAIAASNRRKAEREIAGFIARNGGRLTDNLEREVVRIFADER